ncbi:two-component system capsular synthesis response regulator RcsB [Pseudomonas chlororaphis]|uniref:response regulator n=1 Tax=Pseudomonas chlororaphis TaxID=587753 RepID=UPI00209E1060|nr:response regulator [Pseudomonas chlororaphis]MCP1482834.1 two-component system capsular synthesis response regulator RcsB [Pseudomonas chlororaphis]MCP1596809.1 two-component system capsular synthesis response regulator RcsB [Pseudomonas chlororaphis]
MQKKVIIADDHLLTLIGIRASLSSDSTLQIVGEAQNVEGLFQLLAEQPCDLVVTDLMMPHSEQADGLRLIEQLRRRYPQIAVIVVTMLNNPALLASILKLGVQGLISKRGVQGDLQKAIRASQAKPFVSPSIRHLFDSVEPLAEVEQLSPREVEVLRLYGAGLSVNEIATHLNRSKQTISSQKSSAMRKLGLDSNASLYLYIQEVGLA